MISRLVGALVAVLAALFALPSPAEAFVADVGASTFVCDSAALHGSVHRDLATERGPPAPRSTDTIQEAVDRSSRGALARPAGATPSPTTAARPATHARSARPTTTTGREVVVAERELSPLQRFHVAAKAEAGSIRGVNPLRGSQNCVNCAIATDSTLGGAPMSALNFGPQPISVLEKVYGGTFKSVAGRSQIEQMLADAGPGARGIVFGSRGSQVGHVFNAVNQRGTIRFLDGQSGGSASFDGFDGFMFLRTN